MHPRLPILSLAARARRLAALALSIAAFAAAAPAAAELPQPPALAARQYLLVDVTSDQVLAERDADARADPASLTKIMTAYLVFQALGDGKLTLEQTLPVSERAWSERKGGGSMMFIEPRMKPKVDELLRGMIVQSGNDASVALAEGVAGSVESFVEAMNRQAQAWGLRNTQFRNVTGLTESGHYSSARDIATIAARLIRDFPAGYRNYSLREYTFNGIRQDNRNMLLGRDPTVDGMKTGFTEAAGYCLVASARRELPGGERRLLSVVLGTDSRNARASESEKLLNWGWQAWDMVRLFEPGQPATKVPVWKGARSEVGLGVRGGLTVTVPRGAGAGLATSVERTDPLVAPLQAGQAVGTLRVRTAGGDEIRRLPLEVLEPVPLAGLFGRAWDALRLWIR
ncbi:MAG: D-alanyl-D-alanine carboxypeptidase [Burkholderiales bacterium]|nr:D-alanyl-D-alanine carboxypeptidase [Burkholderiales bacterium]